MSDDMFSSGFESGRARLRSSKEDGVKVEVEVV